MYIYIYMYYKHNNFRAVGYIFSRIMCRVLDARKFDVNEKL